jgi:hypothetical protein
MWVKALSGIWPPVGKTADDAMVVLPNAELETAVVA